MSAALNIHGNDPLTVVGARLHYHELPGTLQKKMDSFEKRMIRSFQGKRSVAEHFEDALEPIFSLRLQLFFWFSTRDIFPEQLQDKMQPQLDALCKDPLVGRIGFLVTRALQQNDQLIDSFSEELESSIHELKKTPHVPKIKLESFLDGLAIMGGAGHVFAGLVMYSLFMEMITVCALSIHQKKIKPAGTKLEELLSRAETDIEKYIKYAQKFGDHWAARKHADERASYTLLAEQSFNSVFAEDEPDYGDVEIKNPNPDFQP